MKANTKPRFNPSRKPSLPKTAAASRGGRPASGKETGPLRNFNLLKQADDFLTTEKARTRWGMVNIVEAALLHLEQLPARTRDKILDENLRSPLSAN